MPTTVQRRPMHAAALAVVLQLLVSAIAVAQVTAIKAGRLVDPEAGTVATNQVILVEKGKFTAIGPNVVIPAGAEVIDLSAVTVLPGLVDAHNQDRKSVV